MKRSDFFQQPYSDLLGDLGAFFAFSDSQFNEAKKEGIVYCSFPCGLICPKENAAEYVRRSNEIYWKSIEQDKEANTAQEIILRELHNHESYYDWDTSRAIDALKDYGYTVEEIQQVFNDNIPEDSY